MSFFALSYLLGPLASADPSGRNTTHGLFIKEHQSTLSRSTYLRVTETNFYMPSQILHSLQTVCLTDNRNIWHILNEVSFRFKGKEISWINDSQMMALTGWLIFQNLLIYITWWGEGFSLPDFRMLCWRISLKKWNWEDKGQRLQTSNISVCARTD